MSKKVKDKVGYLVDDETKEFLDAITKSNEVLGMKIFQIMKDTKDKLYLTFEITEVMKQWVKE